MTTNKGDYDCILKYLVIGDSGVGKTCVLLRFCENTFTNDRQITSGIDFKLKTMEVDGKKIKLQIWDTAGQERYKTITQNYYKGAMGIILTYSIVKRESFESIQNWIQQINDHADEDVSKILIGTKADMNGERQISREEGDMLANQYGIKFFETSAKDGLNMKHLQKLLDNVIKKLNKNQECREKMEKELLLMFNHKKQIKDAVDYKFQL